MGGYILPNGQKLQTDDYVDHLEERNRELVDAGDRLAREVELRWSGPGGCDCPVCTAAQAWRSLRAEQPEVNERRAG